MYNLVSQLQQLGTESHVVCDRTENLEQFSIPNIHSLETEPFIRRTLERGLRNFRFRHHLDFLARICKETSANIVHSHFGNVGWADLGAMRKINARHVVSFYGLDVNKLPVQEPVWRKRYHQLFTEADLILCEGSHMARCVTELGCPDNKIKVQHLGVDVDNIRFQSRQWRSGEPLKVLIAASFREKKGIPTAIDALQIISDEVPVLLTIIGDAGPKAEYRQEKARILEALDRSGLKEHTRLLGYQTHKAMFREAYDHHLFLQPSITAQDGDTEGGAPVSIIEMLATGMPVVATTHCDIPEVMGPASTHLIAPENDAVELANCIRSLLNDPESWSSIAREGRKHVEHEYHLPRQASRLLAHYNELL